jgi:hypothetical protein
MGAEAIFRDTVSVVATTLVPGTMLTLPVVCALALPDVLPYVVRGGFRPSYLMQLPAVRPMFRHSLDCLVGLANLLMPILGLTLLVIAVRRCRWVSAFVLVGVAFLVVGIATLMVFRPAILCAGKHRCS